MRLQKISSLVLTASLVGMFAIAEEEATTLEETVTPFSLSASTHVLFSNSKDEMDADGRVENRLLHEGQVRTEYGSLGASLSFNNKFIFDRPREMSEPLVLEKKRVGFELSEWEVWAGDTHQELGRGIALSLYRDPAFGVDNTLEGLSLRWKPSGLDVAGFAGRVNAWDLPVAINPLTNNLLDREVVMGAGQVGVNITDTTKIGAHYLYALSRPLTNTRYEKRWQTLGGSLSQEGLLENVDAYVESNIMWTDRIGQDTTQALPTAYGSYGSLSYAPQGWKAKLEGKDYRNYQFEFRRPPTLEEDIVETLNTEDVSAGRIQVEHQFEGTKTSLMGSYLLGDDRIVSSTIHHGVFGTKFVGPGKSEFEFRTGYRTLPGKSQMLHGSLKTKVPTARGQSLELGIRKQIAELNQNILPTNEDRNLFDAGYNFSERFTLTVGLELIPTNDAELGTTFANAGATYKTGDITARAFLGKTSGGTQCSGGVCRQVPPYTGALVDATYTF